MNRMDLIVARFAEDLNWLLDVPDSVRIIVYNKGSDIGDKRLLERVDVIEKRMNKGREADSYLAHLRSGRSEGADWVVFTQGNPFPHSPDFIPLLGQSDRWAGVQPLTLRWLESRGVPPAFLVDHDERDWLGNLRVRREIFSLRNWGAVSFLDDGIAHTLRGYLNHHGAPHGTNLAEHFLRLATWDELADQAGAADLGSFCYGAIFGVSADNLKAIPEGVLDRLQELAASCPVHAYVFERLWLHFFGEPFLRITRS